MNPVQGPGGRGRELEVDIKETLLTVRMEGLGRQKSNTIVCSLQLINKANLKGLLCTLVTYTNNQRQALKAKVC